MRIRICRRRSGDGCINGIDDVTVQELRNDSLVGDGIDGQQDILLVGHASDFVHWVGHDARTLLPVNAVLDLWPSGWVLARKRRETTIATVLGGDTLVALPTQFCIGGPWSLGAPWSIRRVRTRWQDWSAPDRLLSENGTAVGWVGAWSSGGRRDVGCGVERTEDLATEGGDEVFVCVLHGRLLLQVRSLLLLEDVVVTLDHGFMTAEFLCGAWNVRVLLLWGAVGWVGLVDCLQLLLVLVGHSE